MAAAFSSEQDLEELIQKITDPACEGADELAVNLFCSAVRSDPTLIKKSTELIVNKIKSTNITQSRKALELLEECMSKCGPEFQVAIARFQFLNELIRLVSKKFSGDETPSETRNKILDCLSLWTVQYPDRMKIKEAYETLLRSGVQHEVAPPIATSGKKVDFVDEENEKLLRKLLQSKNREDFQRANLLIKYLVKQDAKKIELAARQRLELQEARNSATILSQIVDHWLEDGQREDEELAKEIYEICKKSKQIVMRMSEIIDENEELLGDALEVNEMLGEIIEKYDELVSSDRVKPSTDKNAQPFLTDLLSGVEHVQEAIKSPANALDELSDVFLQNLNATTITPQQFNLLDPIPLKSNFPSTVIEKNVAIDVEVIPGNSAQTLSGIDKLSEDLFKENLTTERIGSFKREPSKISINNMLKGKTEEGKVCNVPDAKIFEELDSLHTKSHPFAEISSSILDSIIHSAPDISQPVVSLLTDLNDNGLEAQTAESKKFTFSDIDDLLLDKTTNKSESVQIMPQQKDVPATDDEEIVKISDEGEVHNKSIKHLSEIAVDFNSIRPSNESPRIVMDDIQGLRVTLNFTLDRPTEHVKVIVISTINQSSIEIKNYQIDASVKKPCKVRLLPATASSLPGVKPFRPPSEHIQQILLLSNPTKSPVDLTCIIGYQQGDDPDPIKESVVVKNIPY